MGLKLSNFTLLPNELFDEWLPQLGLAELKVLMVIIRQNFERHKLKDRISLSQLEFLTGIERRHILKATKTLQEKGLITKVVEGECGTQCTRYELNATDIASIPPPLQKNDVNKNKQVMIDIDLITNKNISLKCRILIIYFISLQEKTKTSMPAIFHELGLSKDSGYKILDEAIQSGYISREIFLEKGLKKYRYRLTKNSEIEKE